MINIFTKNEQRFSINSEFWNHNHTYSVTLEDYFRNVNLSESCHLTITSKEKDGKIDFVSSIESNKYPFYGVIFHIEINLLGC